MTKNKLIFMVAWMFLAETAYAYTPKQIEFYAKQRYPKAATCKERARVAKEIAEKDGWRTWFIHEVNSRGRHRALGMEKNGVVVEILH